MLRVARRALAAALLCAVSGAPALAQGEEEGGDRIAADAYQRVNESLVTHHVLPRYRRLAEAAAHFHEGVAASCASRDPGALAGARAGYHRTMDAWMAMQHLPFGPLEQQMRTQRLYFWPQARGKVGEAVAGLLAGTDAALLSPPRFSGASVAVQGLPAAEHLLFERPAVLAGEGETRHRGCALLGAIAANLREIAGAALREWRDTPAGGPPSFADLMLRPGPDNADFPAPKEATLLFFTALHDGLQFIARVKLGPVVGATRDAPRPRLAESLPSGRATRNVVLNLEALQALYAGEEGPGLGTLVAAHEADAALDPLMRKAFRLTLETARAIGVPLDAAVSDPALRPRTGKLLVQVRALERIVRTRVTEALDLRVGFNALDGD